MLGAYVAYSATAFLMERLGAPLGFWSGIVLAAVAVGVVGVVMEVAAAATDLPCARAVPAAGHLRCGAGRAGCGAGDLGPGGSVRAACAGPEGDRRDPRRALPAVSPVPDRARARRARRAVAAVPSHALGRAGAGCDPGSGDGRCARRQRALAVHQRAVPGLVAGRPGRCAADSQGSGEPADGHPHHRRGLRGGGDRRHGQRDRRLSRGAAGRPAVCVRHPHLPAGHPGAHLPGDGGGAGGPALRAARQAGGAPARRAAIR